MDYELILSLMTIFGIAATWQYYVGIKPLKTAFYSGMSEMNKAIAKLEGMFEASITDRRILDRRISKLEEAMEHDHERLEYIETLLWKDRQK